MKTSLTQEHENADLHAAASGDSPQADYDTWLADEIAAGCAELDAGQGIPADQVWKKLGLE